MLYLLESIRSIISFCFVIPPVAKYPKLFQHALCLVSIWKRSLVLGLLPPRMPGQLLLRSGSHSNKIATHKEENGKVLIRTVLFREVIKDELKFTKGLL